MPFVKAVQFNYLATYEDRKKYIISLATDFIFATLYYKVVMGVLVGAYYVGFPLVVSLVFVGTEYLTYLLIRKPQDSYKIQKSDNPMDFLLTVVLALNFLTLGLSLNFEKFPTKTTFPFFLLCLGVADILFGYFHVATHKNPALWPKHQVHHQYKREDLNTFANFYADLLDGFLMNISLFAVTFLTLYFDQSSVVLNDMLYVAFFAHHKYPSGQYNMMWFFEYDVIDILFGKPRISSFHAEHHQALDRSYCNTGFISDQFILKLYYTVHKYIPIV